MKNSIIPMPVAQSRGGLALFGLVLLWSGFVFAAFFSNLGHSLPFWGLLFNADAYPPAENGQWFQVWSGSLRALLTTIVVLGVTLAAGKRVRAILSINFQNSWTAGAFDFGLGVVSLGFFWIGTGLCGLWFSTVWWSFAVVLTLLWVWDTFNFFRHFSWSVLNSVRSMGPGYGFLCLMGLGYGLLTLLVNLTPETFYDSMVYHLAVPQYWLSHHGLSDFPTNFFSNYPYGAETYFLNGLVFQGTEAAKMLHAVCFFVCAVMAGGWAREISGKKAGFLALGLVLTLPLFALNTWTTQVEGLLALAVTLFIYTLTRWAKSQQVQWALAAGIFAGLTIAVKYNGAIAIVSVLVVIAFQTPGFYRKDRWKNWFCFAAAFLLVAGPWVIKNLVYTGNPFFPYFASWFQGLHLSPQSYERLLTEQQGRMTSQWWDWLILPWKIVMANPDSYSFAGPVALALLPLLFLFKLKHPTLRFLAWGSVLIFGASLAVTHILRFMVPDFVLFYVLLAAVLAGGDRPALGKAAAWTAGFSALLCAGYLANIIHYYYDFSGIVSGRQTQEQYLEEGKLTSYYGMAQWLSAHLPEDKRLLIVGDARGLYYQQPFLTNTVFDTQTLAQIAAQEKDAEGIAHRLREMGVDYLVVNSLEGIRVSADYHHYDLTSVQWQNLDEFIQRGTKLMYSENLQSVYGLLSQLQARPKDETLDMVLFFSPSASQFFVDVQKKNWKDAQTNLYQTVELYPFSAFWKKQKADFDKSISSRL